MINKLIEKIRKTNAPIVVGLDPMLNYIPKHIQENAFAEFLATKKSYKKTKKLNIPKRVGTGQYFHLLLAARVSRVALE